MVQLDTFNFLPYDIFERHVRHVIIFWLKGTSRTFTFFFCLRGILNFKRYNYYYSYCY